MYHIAMSMGSHTGLPKDVTVNTFSFTSVAAKTDAEVTDLILAVIDFYNAVPSTDTAKLSINLSAQLSRASDACRAKAWFLTGRQLEGAKKDDPPTYAGSPQVDIPWTLAAGLGAGVGIAIPSEVSCAVTLEGEGRADALVEGPGDTRPRGRRTGKLFIGPFHTGVLDQEFEARVPAALANRINAACKDLAAASDTLGMPWSVWSRSDATLRVIDHVSVANDWDTQRRRGLAATGRTRIVVP